MYELWQKVWEDELMAEINDLDKRRGNLKEMLEKGCITQEGFDIAMINLDKIERGERRDR